MKNLVLVSILFLIQLVFVPTIGAQVRGITHKVVVREVIQTSNYTYLLLDEDGLEQWLATPKMQAKVGDTCYYTGGMIMTDFESKELKRTFKRIIFTGGVSSSPNGASGRQKPMPAHGKKPKAEQKEIKVKPLEGGITLAELLANKEKYEGKTVRIRGQVMKYNTKILGKNWIHIQDGTSSGGEFDLTVTTNAEMNVGDVVIIEGKVTLDKDFGHGYFFKIIIEDAKVTK